MRRDEQKPHLLWPTIADSDGRISWSVTCPYDSGDDTRPCKLFEEAHGCETIGADGECDEGGRSFDFGHGHLSDECAAVFYLRETGMGEGAWFNFADVVHAEESPTGQFFVYRLPVIVAVGWESDGIELYLQPQPQP